MLDIIKRLFQGEPQEAPTKEVVYVEVPRNEPTDTTYYYLNLMLNGLNRDYNYMLMEELKDGTIITHMQNAPYQSVRDYCRSVWLPSHPAKFILHAT